MSNIALVHTTFPDADGAQAIAERMVADGLAACANVMQSCVSVYRWEDGIAQDIETPVLFKAAIADAEALREAIVEFHPYDLPVVEIWPATVSEGVAGWVEGARDE